MPAPDTKTVYLIRHAESLENERIACLTRSLSSLSRFALPRRSDIRRSVELLNVPAQVNSDVSPQGRAQIEQMAEKLAGEDFLNSNGITLVAHSPLLRARQTAEGMLGCCAAPPPATAAAAPLPPPVERAEELQCLTEKTPAEWVPGNHGPLDRRIGQFESWLCSQEDARIAIVGHSQFFKAMLGLGYKFGNCDVWEVTMDCGAKQAAERRSDQGGGAASGEEGEKKDSEPSPLDLCASSSGKNFNGVLPRGWKDLKNIYRCEKKPLEEEDEVGEAQED